MENNDMKKINFILAVLTFILAFTSCEKRWVSEVDLGVFSTRINCENQLAEDFTITVFSNQSWSAQVIAGTDWLTISDGTGNELGFIHTNHGEHFEDYARIGKIKISASNKEIIVNIVQAGNKEKASDVPDELL